jgi:hypothetical protein
VDGLCELLSWIGSLALRAALSGVDAPYELSTVRISYFTFWKDGDPDIPILQQAKAEYAKLK